MKKDLDEQQMRRYRGEIWKGPSTGSAVLAELACATLPARGHVHQPGSPPKPVLPGFYGGCIT